MEPKELKFEDLKDLEYGSLVILAEDPLFKLTEECPIIPYVLICKDEKSYDFVNGMGASLMIKEQETIDAFGVKLIDSDSDHWDPKLSEYGKKMAEEFEKMKVIFNEK